MNNKSLRDIPKMDDLLNNKIIIKKLEDNKRFLVVEALREALELIRKKLISEEIKEYKEEELIEYFDKILFHMKEDKLKRVINGTGVVIHTNLGRSILSKKAAEKVALIASSYNNLEYDLSKGERGERYSHIEGLIKRLTGAKSALVVNNNAAAVLLVLNTICKNREIIVSRGQLVEIGGSFRIPDVMELSGGILKEVGTTNRTHIKDYEEAIDSNTGALLKVHTSNYKIMGFTKEVSIEELVKLGKEYNVPVIEDLGSGSLVNSSPYLEEPSVIDSIKKGVDIVTFSGDKLLGGPQSGIIIGSEKWIDMMKKNQLLRALRVDKMTLIALEITLREYLEKSHLENIPTLKMLTESLEDIKIRGRKIKRRLTKIEKVTTKLEEDYSTVGGGSLPLSRIKTMVISLEILNLTPSRLEKKLRENIVPIIARVKENKVILDIRTIKEEDYNDIYEAILSISKGE